MNTRTHPTPQRRAPWHDAYDAQMQLWRWYRTEMAMRWMQHSYAEAARNLNVETQEMLSDLYQHEFGRLIDCDPVYVSADMCEVIDAAKDDFQPEPLLESDLITTRGFVYFARPFEVPDRFDVPTTIAGFSWSRIIAHEDKETAKRLQREVQDEARDAKSSIDARLWEEVAIEKHGATPTGVAITIYASNSDLMPGDPALIPYHVTPWWFGMEFDGNEVDENGDPTGAAWWWKVVQVTFRLMQQKISVKHQERPDRASRREAKSLAFPDEQTVVVVRLRREGSERHDPSDEGANYSHRFIVHGFWRNQWYPSDEIHRQIYIDDYVKGPEDKPLIVKPRRVFQWDR